MTIARYKIPITLILIVVSISAMQLTSNAKLLFEIILILLVLSVKDKTIHKTLIPLTICSIVYILTSFALMAFYTEIQLLEFLRAYKSFMYLPIIAILYKKKVFYSYSVSSALKFILIFYLIHYSVQILLGIEHRPLIMTENNYEVAFLQILFAFFSKNFGKSRNFYFIILLSVTLISGSRSAAASLVFVYAYIYMTELNWKTILAFCLFPLMLLTALYIFIDRLQDNDIQSIDRIFFLKIFLSESNFWGIGNYLFGTFPLTALSDLSCMQLSYYEKLFSFGNNDTCYSVVLHSFILRAIFDHGLIGLMYIFYCYFRILASMRENTKTPQTIMMLGIILMNSLSVSGLNNIFIVLALTIIISSYDYRGRLPNRLSRKIQTKHS